MMRFFVSFIKCRIFRNIYTNSAIFNSVNQYLVSTNVKKRLKNMIDCTQPRIKYFEINEFELDLT